MYFEKRVSVLTKSGLGFDFAKEAQKRHFHQVIWSASAFGACYEASTRDGLPPSGVDSGSVVTLLLSCVVVTNACDRYG